MKKIKAKFICHHLSETGTSQTAHLHAVFSTEGENSDFAKATPSGNLAINIDNQTPASGFFQIGEPYYLEFSKA